MSPNSKDMTLFGRVACCSVGRHLCASDSFFGCMSFVAPPRRSVAYSPDMTTTQTRASGSPTRWRCWNTAVASRHAGCFDTNMWQTTSRFTRAGLIDCYAEKSPGQTNDRGEGAQGGAASSGGRRIYSNASSQLPRVAAREYSVARFSKKFACSTPLSISSIHGSGLLSI